MSRNEIFKKCSGFVMPAVIIVIAALLFVCVSAESVSADADEGAVISCESSGIQIVPVEDGGIQYLYLPNDENIDITDLELKSAKAIKKFDKGVFSETVNEDGTYIYRGDFSQLTDENNCCSITFADGSSINLVIAKSVLPSVSVSLNDTTLSDITSGSKDIKYSGNTVFITDENGKADAQGISNVQIKGRGNSTWRLDKKPYQIKFDSKTSVLGMKKAKKWVLLANYLDGSLLRNKISYNLAADSGIAGSLSSEFTDLWIDGEYQGSYLICQKADSGSGNLNLSDNGILAEMDNLYYEDEDYWFYSEKSNSYFTLKECNSEDNAAALFDDFESRITAAEDLIYAEKKDWDKITELINEDSFARMYLLFEYTENEDAMKSSVYFYCDGGEIYMGPAWDFDRSLGNCNDQDTDITWLGGRADPEGLLSTYFSELKTVPEFNELVNKIYSESFGPALDKALADIDAEAALISDSAGMNQRIWKTFGKNLNSSMTKTADSYDENVSLLREWMTARKAYMDKNYDAEFISAELPADGYYTFSSCADKNITLAADEAGNECAYDTSAADINKSCKFSIVNTSENRYTIESLDTGNETERIFTGAGSGYYYIQDTDGKYLTYDNGEIKYINLTEAKPGAAQKWVLYRTAVKNVENGAYVLTSAADSSLNMGVEDGAADKKARINVSSADNRTDQIFYVKHSADGYYTIMSEKSGYVFDIANGSSASGAAVWQYTENKSAAQLWSFVENSDGTYTIVSKKGTVISAGTGTLASGTRVTAVTGDGSDSQKWIMKTPARSIADGTYKIANYKNTDRIIGIKDAAARLADKKTDSTSFDVKWNEEEQAYTIMSDGRALTFAKGCKVYLCEYTGDAQQLWYIEAAGNGTCLIRCKANGSAGSTVKGLMGTSSETMKTGAYIRMTNPKKTESNQWKFADAEEPDYETAVLNARAVLFPDSDMTEAGGSASAQTDADSYQACRFSGRERYKTALAVADGLKRATNRTSFDSIIVASGENYPDALSGSSLVRSKDHAPVLLVSKAVENEIISYISANLSADGRVYLLGGTGVVSERFEKNLKSSFKNKDARVVRLSGSDRYSTNLDILRAAGLEGEELIVCTGSGYADSLSASSTGKTILLVGRTLTGVQYEYIEKELKPSKITIIGGASVVSESVEKSLKSYARKNDIKVERIYGNDRYETSVKIAEAYFDKESSGGTVTLAYGGNFPDGLSGSSMAMAAGSPLILTSNGKTAYAKQYITVNEADKAAVLGGTGVISENLIKSVMKR